MRFTLNKETLDKLNRLRELKPHMTTPELLDWLLSRALKQMDPLAKPEKKVLSDTQTKPNHSSLPKRDQNKPIKPEPLRRPLTRKTKHQVWQRANGCCQFKDHKTGKLCGSRKGLEVDHVRPLSLGGNNTVSNLRLLCKEHHRLLTQMSFP